MGVPDCFHSQQPGDDVVEPSDCSLVTIGVLTSLSLAVIDAVVLAREQTPSAIAAWRPSPFYDPVSRTGGVSLTGVF